ncbi:hypothetical protein CC1G_06325 [Coprinopsis cinerea okayama7|uniref:Uncharacterized protein n=1 Tax=Coprinopsis cinerea (strain Okayama-7 / 130 / ATCC MYA-4618 / FGSC 9003) TaxID=240176 RepID=A8NTI8_COPC7|nr:hypothetical protein CC1G_06325 [Coprinopsis cinerea okayama7\|eukprot:XP_001836240.2 hypothetical protein CC1G_06325 [Coprinopsis cinerea okayama7\
MSTTIAMNQVQILAFLHLAAFQIPQSRPTPHVCRLLFTTTMGLLSALTTGWWGRFGERYGRTKVLAIATFGLFWTDLIFVLASSPSLPFPLSWFSYASTPNRAAQLLLLAPLVEGLLGGWSTLQSATSAYISDCTSPGSRAQIFSRFTGVFYLGFSAGPAIAAWVIRHPELFPFPSSSDPGSGSGTLVDLAGKTAQQRQKVTAVFCIAVICSFINFLLVLFVFPESLSRERREQATRAHDNQHTSSTCSTNSSGYKGKGKEKTLDLPVTGVEDVEGVGIGAIVDPDEILSPISAQSSGALSRRASFNATEGKGSTDRTPSVGLASDLARESIVIRFLRPLAIFLPVYVDMPTRNGLTVKRRKDYSLTLLAAGLFAWMLSTGVYQIKYLYAGHTYRWGAEQLSYYISFMGGARATFLLVLLPFLIATFRSKRKPESQTTASGSSNGKGKARAEHPHHVEDGDVEANDGAKASKKPPPTRLQLGKDIRFDLRLTRCSLLIDIIGNMLVAIAPSPTMSANALFSSTSHKHRGHPSWSMTRDQSQALFILASGCNSFASGMVPAVHSLALCIVQARTLEPDFGIESHSSEGQRGESAAPTAAPVDTGTLFGAFAVLQAVGQMILGPMLFGIVYSQTVASHPKIIFVVATSLLVFALVLISIVKNPVGEVRLARKDKKFRRRMEAGYGALAIPYSGPNGSGARYIGGGIRKAKGKNWERDIERRGRPRQSKDLRGGAIGWYCHPEGKDRNGGGNQHLIAQSA